MYVDLSASNPLQAGGDGLTEGTCTPSPNYHDRGWESRGEEEDDDDDHDHDEHQQQQFSTGGERVTATAASTATTTTADMGGQHTSPARGEVIDGFAVDSPLITRRSKGAASRLSAATDGIQVVQGPGGVGGAVAVTAAATASADTADDDAPHDAEGKVSVPERGGRRRSTRQDKSALSSMTAASSGEGVGAGGAGGVAEWVRRGSSGGRRTESEIELEFCEMKRTLLRKRRNEVRKAAITEYGTPNRESISCG